LAGEPQIPAQAVLKIATDRSMLQLTVERLLSKMPIGDIYIVTAASQVKLVLEHLPSLPWKTSSLNPLA
jgi:mannose-1-phosphate guanylyltransferase